jgi:hypothetical protein
MTMSITEGGLFRLLRPGVLEHHCPGCGQVHAIDIHALSKDGRVTGWDGDLIRPSFGEPLRYETSGGVCEYVVRAGVIYFMNNCWHPLSGKSQTMPEFPR